MPTNRTAAAAIPGSHSIHDSCDLISGSSDGVNGDWNFSHSPFRAFPAEWLRQSKAQSVTRILFYMGLTADEKKKWW